MRQGIKAERIHGNRSQPQRTAALAGFKAGRYRVLVATDIAARGIDVEALGHVVNFDVPQVPEDYIHRVGRTARAEATGDAFTFVSPQEEEDLRRIERGDRQAAAARDRARLRLQRAAGGEAGDPDRRAHRRDSRTEGAGARALGGQGWRSSVFSLVPAFVRRARTWSRDLASGHGRPRSVAAQRRRRLAVALRARVSRHRSPRSRLVLTGQR